MFFVPLYLKAQIDMATVSRETLHRLFERGRGAMTIPKTIHLYAVA